MTRYAANVESTGASVRQLGLEAFGVRARVRCHHGVPLEPVELRLPPSSRLPPGASCDREYTFSAAPSDEEGDSTARYALHAGRERLATSSSLDSLFDSFERDLAETLALADTEWTFVHAGVVFVDGAAILLPGFSFSGKSTLVRELVRLGAEYGSDEYAVLDPDGLVHPYPRPISLRGRGGSGRDRVRPERLEGPVATGPGKARQVLVTQYERDGRWHPQPMTAADGVLALFEHAVAARTKPALALRALAHLARDARFFRSPRGEAATTASLILEALSTDREGP